MDARLRNIGKEGAGLAGRRLDSRGHSWCPECGVAAASASVNGILACRKRAPASAQDLGGLRQLASGGARGKRVGSLPRAHNAPPPPFFSRDQAPTEKCLLPGWAEDGKRGKVKFGR